MKGGDNGENLNHLVGHITPAIEAAPNGASVNEVVKENARLSAKELKQRSDIIRQAVEAGKVRIVPAYYNLGSGKVDLLNQ